MFWKKKQMVATTVVAGTTPAVPTGVTATRVEVPAPSKAEKLPGPQGIPNLVGMHLVVTKKRDPDWVWHLKAVVRKNPSKGKKALSCRVFDEVQVAQEKVKIKDWTTLDQHPDLILYEGWFDKDSMKLELEESSHLKQAI